MKLGLIGLTGLIGLMGLMGGCASAPPSALEQHFFEVRTNVIPVIVPVTNVVEMTNWATVTVTNRVEVINEKEVVVPVTNVTLHSIWATNVVTVTNQVEAYTFVPGTNAVAVTETAREIGGLWGPWGELIGLILGGVFGIWGLLRSSRANKTAAVLAQVIETGKQLLRLTPQGNELDATWTAWMKEHQRETGTMLAVIQLLNNVVDEPSAKQVAAELRKLIEERTRN